MSSWDETIDEVNFDPGGLDEVRRRKVRELAQKTGRNVICYYSGWLQRQDPSKAYLVQITDDDKHGFMTVLHGMDASKGLDLILHCPGGDLAATESLIHYLRSKFGADIRCIVPQISMSGGTLMAFCGKEIVMARHSNLGPIDPQLGDMSVVDILADWDAAKTEIVANPAAAGLWNPIIQKYPLGFINHVEAINQWGKDIGTSALIAGMLAGATGAPAIAARIVDVFSSKQTHHSHARHLHREECESTGLIIKHLEDDQALQDLVLSIHHAYIVTLASVAVGKIVENDSGKGKITFL